MLPGAAIVLGGIPAPDPVKALIFGIAIVGAAFVLSWAAEVVQLDFSQGLALALLALIAILPEYVVDATYAYLAAEDPAYAGYAVANMTGANRLLIGIAWPMVVAIGWLKFRRSRVVLESQHGLELTVLLLVTIYAFTIPFRGEISLSFLLLLSGCGDALRLEVVFDDCPNDVEKIYPGECGCGIAEERCVPLKSSLVHRYAFNGRGPVAVDDIGGADGTILNTELSGLGQLYLDRSAELEQYVELPNGIVSALDSATFETWVTWEAPPTEPKPFWERIFDFGVSTLGEEQRESGKSYLFLAPGQPGTTPRLPRTAFRDLHTDGEVIIDAADATPAGAMVNMAVVVDAKAQELVLFMNGVEQGRTAPLSLGLDTAIEAAFIAAAMLAAGHLRRFPRQTRQRRDQLEPAARAQPVRPLVARTRRVAHAALERLAERRALHE
jgi:hypothetical protein